MDLCVGAVVARHAADKIGIVLRAARGLAELAQQVDAVFIGRFDGGHAVGAVLQGRGNIARRFVVFQQAPGRVVDACDAAHVGRTLAQARHKALVGHVFDRAVFAVDRDNAAHIAVAEHIAVVLAAGRLQVAAHKAADKAAHKAAAQHIAGLGAAVSQGDIAAKADQTADEIALQGAFLVQRTIRIVARPHQGGQGGGAQAAAGSAGAALQLQVAGIARDAAKELAQHRAFLCRAALVVGPGQHCARVVQLGQGGGSAAGRVQVARDAARKAVAHHGGLVGDAGQGAHRAARIRQVGDVQHTGHAAHADSTPKRFCGGRIRHSVITCFFSRIGADFGRGAAVFGSIGIGKQARDGDIFVQRQVAERRPAGRHGKADEPANAVRLVCNVGSVYAGGAGGLAAKRQRRRDLGLGPAAAAAVDRAVGHAAGIHTGQRTHRVNLCAVGRVCLGKRLQIPGAVRVDRHGVGQLLTVCHDLGIDLHIGVAQGDFRQFAVVFADQTHIVVPLAVVQPAAALLRRDRGAAQLQVADDDVAPANFPAVHAAGQGDVFAHGGDGRPGYDLAGAAGHLGDGFGQPGFVLFLPRAVDGHAAVGPVQRGRGVGGQCAVIPCIGAAVDPAQVVQVAEIFQCCVGFGAARGKQGVLGVGLRLLALGAGIGKSIVGTCFHLDIDILRAADQPRYAEQRRLGRGLVIFRRAQQRGVAHGVQRQDKAALAVAEREAVGLAAVRPGLGGRIVLPVDLDAGVLVVACNFTPFDFQLEQRGIAACGAVKFGVVDGVQVVIPAVAAPVQGERFVVDKLRILDLQAGLAQGDDVDGILGRVVAHQRSLAAVGVAAVVNKGRAVGVPVGRKAHFCRCCVVKSRVHLPCQAVDLQHDGRIEKRLIVDIRVKQGVYLLAGGGVGGVLVVVQRHDAAIQLLGLILGAGGVLRLQAFGGKVAVLGTVCGQLLEKIVHIAAGVLAGQGDLRRLENGAGVRLVMLKPRQAGIGDQPGPAEPRQNGQDDQHDHQLHQRKAPGRAHFLFNFLYNRQHVCYLLVRCYAKPLPALDGNRRNSPI